MELQNKLINVEEENKNLSNEIEMKLKANNQENTVIEISNNTISSKSSTASSATPECFEIITTEDNTSFCSSNEQEWIKLEENKFSADDGSKISITELFHKKLNTYFSSSIR